MEKYEFTMAALKWLSALIESDCRHAVPDANNRRWQEIQLLHNSALVYIVEDVLCKALQRSYADRAQLVRLIVPVEKVRGYIAVELHGERPVNRAYCVGVDRSQWRRSGSRCNWRQTYDCLPQ